MTVTGPWQRTARAAGLLGADGTMAPTIFAAMSALATERGAINLGQGFPDEDPPAEVAEAAREAIARGVNQYPPGRGMAVLREAIATHQRHWYGLSWDAGTEVLVTAGATEALAATLLAFVNAGDEVVVVEPYYDAYAALVGLAGGRLVPVPARAPDFLPDPERLAAAITDRTAVVLLNTPHNPTGAMLPDATIELVLERAERHDALVVADEVYEHLTFTRPHRSLATFPGGRERGLTISSAAKSLNVTGWKIGWITARPELLEAVLAVKQFLTFVNGAPFQPAVALGLGLPDDWFAAAAARLDGRRARITTALETAGFVVNRPDGSYFQIADGSPLGLTDAVAACHRLADEVGVVAIPVSAFLADPRDRSAASLLRFAACKTDAVIDEAAQRLAGFRA
ncbi:MAG: aminotransferase class I/II-fold pyridoxal phosphate-dependent enzyme [Propioniciclava sp.]|uniref:aminotransferase class I/II-fold pyridoxal phosphate-dependent enzyme n=1 Tax=Propioniciclava sp. TaxID=2038686 RepID=UPI0039E656B5